MVLLHSLGILSIQAWAKAIYYENDILILRNDGWGCWIVRTAQVWQSFQNVQSPKWCQAVYSSFRTAETVARVEGSRRPKEREDLSPSAFSPQARMSRASSSTINCYYWHHSAATSLSRPWEMVKHREPWRAAGPGVTESDTTGDWAITTTKQGWFTFHRC